MRRLRINPAPAIVILMLLLAIAAVTRGAVGYDISPWSVAGGGVMFSSGGNYSLGGTIGQPSAGQIGVGGYTLGSGFWGGGVAAAPKLHRPAFLPFVSHIRAPSPAFCDQYEPNNSRYKDATALTSTDELTAKICANDVETRYPNYDFEDNYAFDTITANPIQVKITLPTTLRSRITIGIYANSALSSPLPDQGCYIDQFANIPFFTTCTIPKAGRYTVRLYSADGTVDNVNSYRLQVIFQ